MKKLVSLLLAFVLCGSLTLSAFAVSPDDERGGIYSPIEVTAEASTALDAARAGIEIDIYRSGYLVPDSTPLLNKGVVSDGIITYQIRVGILVTNNGTATANQSVTWSTSASSTNARFVSGDSSTNSYGQAFAYFHVRDLSSFPVSVTCGGVTATETIVIPTDQLYDSYFDITYYITADENDYDGSKTESVDGISGLFKPKFLSAVRLNGSGRASDGRFLKYYNGTYSLETPTTASGTTPVVDKTIAVDPFYIPMVNRNGWKRGVVDIMSTGLRRAEDTGGAIDEFHIDVYVGVGKSNVTEDNHSSAVLFKGVNTWDTLSAASAVATENYWDMVEVPEAEEAVQTDWVSVDGDLRVFVASTDYSDTNSSVEVKVAKTTGNNDVLATLRLSTFSLSLVDVTFIDETHVGIESHINPSTNVYEIFDLNTGLVTDTYYGYGFTHYNDTVYYIQAPQHFSGVRGNNRILTSDGQLIYESDAGVTIDANLTVKNGGVYFAEINNEMNGKEMRTVNLSENVSKTRSGSIYYY